MFIEFLWSGGLGSGGSSFQVHCPLPPPSTCISETSRVLFLCLGVCQSSDTLRRSGQDTGTSGLSGSRLLQPAVSSAEVIAHVGDLVINFLSLNSYVTLSKFMVETVSLMLGLIRKGDFMLFLDLKDIYFQIPIHLAS